MSALLSTPTMAPVDLSTRAMLVQLTISKWNASKIDKRATRDVATQNNSKESMARVVKKLIEPGSTLDRIQTIHSRARDKHYSLTLPWSNDGARILASQAYFKYTSDMRVFRDEIEPLVAQFCREYPALIEDARRSLSGLHNYSDYPSVHEIQSKFIFGYNVFPMPQVEDFRIDLGRAEITRIQDSMQTQLDAIVQNAVSDMWQQMIDPVSKLASGLRAYTPAQNGMKADNVFRDSLVENVREMLQRIALLDLGTDTRIRDTARQIERELCAMSADQLRCSSYDRQEVADKAEDILRSMNEFFA